MSVREKVFGAGLVAGLVILITTGVLAFVQERRLLTMQQLAEAEGRSEQLLDDFADYLRDFRREGFDYVLVRDEESLRNFNSAAAAIDGTALSLRTKPDLLGSKPRLDAVLNEVDGYVSAYRQIIETARTGGTEAALRQAGELIQAARLDGILEALDDIERENIVAFAERSAAITQAARAAIVAIGFFLVLALGLIAVSVAMMLRYYAMNKSLLLETTELNQGLEASRKEMESIVSFVSHDLRAPLINVKGFSAALAEDSHRLAGLIEKASLPPETKDECSAIVHEDMPESVDFIRNAADTMEKLITTMVKVARAGQLPVDLQRINVNAMVDGIVKDCEFRLQEAQATVEVEPLPDCTADPDQVRQVFSNLIDNAIKYREPSRPLRIRVTGTIEAGQNVYCIQDNGVGIDEKDMKKVFEMYHQVEKAAGGQGLGLAIAKKMVERNGGMLEVTSQPGQGSKFFVRLKAAGHSGRG